MPMGLRLALAFALLMRLGRIERHGVEHGQGTRRRRDALAVVRQTDWLLFEFERLTRSGCLCYCRFPCLN